MALVFPRDMTELVRWAAPSLMPMHRQELSRRAGGLTQAKDLGPTLWVADWTSVPLRLDDADAVMAEFSSLRGAVNTFYLYPPTRMQPRATPDPAPDLSGVLVDQVRADNAAVSLGGLPAGFTISAGDYISIATGAGGREFLRVVRGGQAGGGGVVSDVEVETNVRPSVAVGNGVTLIKPLIEMRLDPGTLKDSFDGKTHRTIQFKATQVVR